jgi:ribosomal protein L14
VHRKHIRATVGTGDVDIPTGTFIANRFLYYNGIAIITVAALQGPVSSTDNAVTRWDGTTGTVVQNSTVIIDDAGNVTGVTTLNTRDVARWVDGPAAGGSTDNAIARWDGTTGRLIQNSVVAIDDTGAVTGITSIGGVPVSDFVRGPTPAVAVDNHIATWDLTSGRLIQDSGLHIGDVCYNFDAEAITNNLPKFQNSTGRRLTDSGIPAANVVQSSITLNSGVDNRLTRWDGTTGRVVQSSAVTLDDSGNITGATINGVNPSTWVRGPASAVNGNLAAFSGTDGKAIFDTGITSNSGSLGSVVNVTMSGNLNGVVNVTMSGTLNSRDPDEFVRGPAGANDNRIARYDGTTGYLIQNSAVTLDDSGNISGVGTLNGATIGSWVVGPSSATDNAIARYDSTTGKLIQNSLLTISDSGDLAGVVQINSINIANYMITSTGNSIGRVPVYNSGSSVTQSAVTISSGGVVAGVSTLNGTDPATWVAGPSSATDSRIAVYDGATGKLLKNGTKLEADVVTGPSSTTSGLVAVFSGTTGKVIASGTRQEAALVEGPSVVADNRIARFDGTTGKLIQESAITIDDSGNISGAGTYNTVNVASHALRHCAGGADPIFSGTPVEQDVLSFTGSSGLFEPRAIFARGTTSSGGNPIDAFVFAPRAGVYIIHVAIPYALSDTGGSITITITWSSGTGSFTVMCGAQGGRIPSSGGSGSLAAGGTTPPPIPASGAIIIHGNLSSVSAGATLTIALGTTGVTYSYYEGYFTVHEIS